MDLIRRIVSLCKNVNLNIALFLLPLFLFGILNSLPMQKNQVSQIENRVLKPVPTFTVKTLFAGTYLKGYEDYFNDNFIFRDRIVTLSSELKKLKGFQSEDNVMFGTVPKTDNPTDANGEFTTNNQEEKTKDQAASQSKNQNTTDQSENNSPNEVINNYLILGDRAIEIHKYKEKEYVKYAQALNAFQEKMDDGVTLYSLLVPTAFEFMNNDKYKQLGDPEVLGIDKVNSTLSKSIVRVNAYEALKANADQYLYFRTDIHWTGLGAYYAYKAFMEAKGEQPVSLDNYQEEKMEGYLGTLYGATLNKNLFNHPDTIYYYQPLITNQFYAVEKSTKTNRQVIDYNAAKRYDKYCLFLGGLRMRGEISTNEQNGKKLLVIKDSFGNAFIPFLIPHYQEIYIVDPRACDINVKDFIREKGIQEVLFINNVFSITSYGFPDLIPKIAH